VHFSKTGHIREITLVKSPLSGRDRFVSDCAHHHAVFRYRTRPVNRAFVPQIAGSSSSSSSLRRSRQTKKADFQPPSLPRKIPFPTPISETGSMTGWWVTSSSPTTSTTHTLKLYEVRDTRNSSAMSKTCLLIFLATAVSARAFKANEANSGSCLCAKKFRSWLEYRRPVRSLRGEHAVWSR
jgi:hypothetical protein